MKTSKTYKNINLPALNKNQLKEIDALKVMKDEEIDTTDIPEATKEMLDSAHFYYVNPIKKDNGL